MNHQCCPTLAATHAKARSRKLGLTVTVHEAEQAEHDGKPVVRQLPLRAECV